MPRQPEKNADTTLEWLKELNLPLTRENYLDVAYAGDPPEEEDIEPELEATFPKEIRKTPPTQQPEAPEESGS